MFNELLLLRQTCRLWYSRLLPANATQRNLVSDLATVRQPSIGEGTIFISQSALEERSEEVFSSVPRSKQSY